MEEKYMYIHNFVYSLEQPLWEKITPMCSTSTTENFLCSGHWSNYLGIQPCMKQRIILALG